MSKSPLIPRHEWLNVPRGFLMGGADIIPGVSGGTVALILGIYERLVTAISRFDRTLLSLLMQRQWLAAAAHIDGAFLLTLGIGIGSGIVCLSGLMHYLLEHQLQPTLAVFFGLILASSWHVARLVKHRKHRDCAAVEDRGAFMPLILPILIPFVAAAVSLLAWRNLKLQRSLGVLGMLGLCGVGIALLVRVQREGILTAHMGNWPAPFGITLVADHFSALMVVVGGIIGLAVAVYSLVNIDAPRQTHAYFPLLHILLMGVSAAFLTGDIFNLYVWFEVLLISSFVLMSLGSEREQLKGALQYVTLNLISSFLFLTAIAMLYGVVGTLNMADAARKLNALQSPWLVTLLSMLFLVAFGIKAAVFPLFFWLPASYHTPPVAVSAVFAGLLTKVGVYALIRVFSLLFIQNIEFTHTLILALSAATMVTGVLGAIAQHEFRRVLSFHIISQIGYMIMGLGLFTPLALAGSVFYIVHHIIVKTNLFLVSGVVKSLLGSERLADLGGLYRNRPGLAILFAVPALSLAGIPPLSGFWAKLILIRAGLESGEYGIVAVALIVSLLTLYSMSKLWNEAFWKRAPEPQDETSQTAPSPGPSLTPVGYRLLLLPIIGLAAVTVLIGAAVEPLLSLAMSAADELLHPQQYIAAVLGESP